MHYREFIIFSIKIYDDLLEIIPTTERVVAEIGLKGV